MKLQPFSLNAKMLAGSLTLGALIVAIGALAVHMSHTIARSSTAILAENVSSLKAAEELEIALLDQKGIVGSYLLDGDEKWLRLLEEKRKKYDDWFTRAKDVALTGHEQRILERIRILYQEYDHLRFQVIQLAQDGSRFAAQQLLLNRVRELVDQLYEACEELLFFNEQLIAESQKKSQQQLTWFQAVLWSSIAVAIFLGLLGGWMVARGMTKRLVQSEKLASLGHMAGLVAHEVRNPLTAIKMRVHSLQEELAASVSSRDDVEVIRQEIERLERIVQNFLDLVRLPEPRMQPLSLHEVVERAVELLKPNFEEHAVRITINWPETLPNVQGDAEQLEQVFLNLLLNAIQAMPEGGAIELAASWIKGRTEMDGSIEIAVSDTGPGIPKALRDKIFDPFFTTKANGIGLGLSLAKKVVERHQGVIDIRDRNGSGTTVTIQLPAKQPVEAIA